MSLIAFSIPFKLTVHQFAVCVQRSDEKIRREIRDCEIEAEGRPYLIHPQELRKHKVDAVLALMRLESEGLLPEKYRYLVPPDHESIHEQSLLRLPA